MSETDIVTRLRASTALMANLCSVRMDVWQEHSTAALSAANEIERLRSLNADLVEKLAVAEKTLELTRNAHAMGRGLYQNKMQAALSRATKEPS